MIWDDYLIDRYDLNDLEDSDYIHRDEPSLLKLLIGLTFSSDNFIFAFVAALCIGLVLLFFHLELYLFTVIVFPIYYIIISFSVKIGYYIDNPEIKYIHRHGITVYNFGLDNRLELDIDEVDEFKDLSDRLRFKIHYNDDLITSVDIKVDDIKKKNIIKSLFTISKI